MSLEKYASNVERRIATRLVDAALSAAYLVSVNDGEEWTVNRSNDRAAILDALASTDSDRLRFWKGTESVGSVWLVWGNEEDLISDSSDNEAIDALCGLAA